MGRVGGRAGGGCCCAPHSEPCSLTCRLTLGRLYSDISDSESDSQLFARPRCPYAALCPCAAKGEVGWDRGVQRVCEGVCRERVHRGGCRDGICVTLCGAEKLQGRCRGGAEAVQRRSKRAKRAERGHRVGGAHVGTATRTCTLGHAGCTTDTAIRPT